MEHKLTIITLSLNYSPLTSLHLHSRHLPSSERGVLPLSSAHHSEHRVAGAAGGNTGAGWSCCRHEALYAETALSTEHEPREVIVK